MNSDDSPGTVRSSNRYETRFADGPLLLAIVPVPWQFLVGVFPAYWPVKTYIAGATGDPLWPVYWVLGVFVHVLALIRLELVDNTAKAGVATGDDGSNGGRGSRRPTHRAALRGRGLKTGGHPILDDALERRNRSSR